MYLLRLILIGVLFGTSMLARAESIAPAIAHMLDYISVDYPVFVRDGKVVDASEYQEQQEFAGRVLDDLRRIAPARPELLRAAEQLKARVDAKAPGDEVARLASALRWRVIDEFKVAVVPTRVPDVSRGAALYAAQCAACHGVNGRGDGPAAASLDPAPANFHDRERMAQRSVYGLYSTITLGVNGTSMKGFGELSEDERWTLAFYVSSLAAEADAVAAGTALWVKGSGQAQFGSLRTLAMLTDNDVKARYGDELGAVFTSLKANPSRLQADASSPVEYSRKLIGESIAAYRLGNRDQAQRLALGAYLEGFELAEASLDAVDSKLRQEVEMQMIAYRDLLRTSAPVEQAAQRADHIDALLRTVSEKLGSERLSPWAAAVGAYFILVREGIEALLVVAALAAFVVKARRREALAWIHAGWIGALALGLVTWFIAARLIAISGATRELTEGATALMAAVILLYVGFWLHDKSHAHAWRSFIEERLKGALQARTLWALTGLSFLTVYREAFETVLFFQALWQQAGPESHSALLTGLASGAASLALLAWVIMRYGVRLPIGPFFLVCSVLMVLLAVVFTGHGIKALQEAGVLAASPVSGINLPMLGIYPTMQTMLAQSIAAATVIGMYVWTRSRGGITTTNDLINGQAKEMK